MKKLSVRSLVYIALFAALMAVCAWLSIPAALPFTMQTFAVFFACGMLGGARGAAAVAVYLLLGAIGLPVFAGFKGGVDTLVGPTGGYLIGFLFSALAMWGLQKLIHKENFWSRILEMAVGLIVCYAFGTAWFMAVSAAKAGTASFVSTLSVCVLPYLVPDALKIALAAFLTGRLKRFVKA